RVVEKRLHHEKRGNDGDIALFDDAHGSLVKEGRVLDRVDPRLRSHAHPARTVRVRCDAQPSVVRLGHGGRCLFWGVLRYLVPFALRSRTVVTPARSAARALRNALSVASASDCRTSPPKFGSPSSVRWQWQLIIPGTTNWPGDGTTSERSPCGVFGIALR